MYVPGCAVWLAARSLWRLTAGGRRCQLRAGGLRRAVRPQSRQSTRDVQRPDYTALVDGEGNRDRDFLAMIAARAFTPAAFPSIKGSDLTLAYLREHDFLEPFLVPSPEDLGMVMPGPDFSVDDVKAYVGTVATRGGHRGAATHAAHAAPPSVLCA